MCEKTETQSGDMTCSRSHSSYVAHQDEISSFLRLIPRVFSFQDASQTQANAYAHTCAYTHTHTICPHMHTLAYTPSHTMQCTHTHALMLTHTRAHAQSTPTSMHTYAHTYPIPAHKHRYVCICTYIHAHHFIHWEGFFLLESQECVIISDQ